MGQGYDWTPLQNHCRAPLTICLPSFNFPAITLDLQLITGPLRDRCSLYMVLQSWVQWLHESPVVTSICRYASLWGRRASRQARLDYLWSMCMSSRCHVDIDGVSRVRVLSVFYRLPMLWDKQPQDVYTYSVRALSIAASHQSPCTSGCPHSLS